MRELIIVVCLLYVLAVGGFVQKKYERWKTAQECTQLSFLLDTGQYSNAHWYLTNETEFLRPGDPEDALGNCP